MDLVAACRAFLAVSGQGSFTAGAAVARIPQSVASRRVAALEEHLGGRVFARSSRTVRLTPFGRDMLPWARRVVDVADAMALDAARARLRPIRLAVPAVCGTLALARLAAAGRDEQVHLDLLAAGPVERAELVRSEQVGAALVAVAPDAAVWQVPVGVATVADPGRSAVHLESLRAGRAARTARRRRIWVQPEDDVAHVRDELTRLGAALGLQPAQVATGASLVAAASEVLTSNDLLACSPAQAEELGLHWRPIGELDLRRGYDLAVGSREDASAVGQLLEAEIGRCLGVRHGQGRGRS
ncbi:helix-turn-helix domain-containing protein [Catellatospora chokoriensis]|uniref:LysR family transcriptional regulator n=1 Tax=Catellatospora chokoriensis TaxID=310353 RepID=A0A8J3K1G8_9ACTN|nr:LysR family transcriptional regulator [Catellatospora chokoriensis]GIF92339.1 LysR family transcriptional regulator [Catellatospora chokoriensis]